MNNLAGLYQAQGDSAMRSRYKQALEIRKAARANSIPTMPKAWITSLRFTLLRRTSRVRSRFSNRHWRSEERRLGEQHPDYAQSLDKLASLYVAQADFARAEPLSNRHWRSEERLGEQHPSYATSLDNLAQLYQAQADYARAEPLLKQALEIRKAALGEQHPSYVQSLNNLAMLYQYQADYARAEPLLKQALEIRRAARVNSIPIMPQSE
ncbi:MAG: tetratricopeptide repeat protein [Pirellulaceae bacterium]